MGRLLGTPVRKPTSLDFLRGTSLSRKRMTLARLRVFRKKAKEFPNLAREWARGRPGILFAESRGACRLGPPRPSVWRDSPGRAGFRARQREKSSSRDSRASRALRGRARERESCARARNHPHTVNRWEVPGFHSRPLKSAHPQ